MEGWEALEGDVFYSVTAVMATMIAVIGQMKKTAPRNLLVVLPMSSNAMTGVAFRCDGNVTKNKIATQVKTRKIAATLEATIESALMTNTLVKTIVASPKIGFVTDKEIANAEKMKPIVMLSATSDNSLVLQR